MSASGRNRLARVALPQGRVRGRTSGCGNTGTINGLIVATKGHDHSDDPSDAVDDSWTGQKDQSPCGVVVCPTSMRCPSGSRM
jgi:hypothetical protein